MTQETFLVRLSWVPSIFLVGRRIDIFLAMEPDSRLFIFLSKKPAIEESLLISSSPPKLLSSEPIDSLNFLERASSSFGVKKSILGPKPTIRYQKTFSYLFLLRVPSKSPLFRILVRICSHQWTSTFFLARCNSRWWIWNCALRDTSAPASQIRLVQRSHLRHHSLGLLL